jgi:hypothetical protein
VGARPGQKTAMISSTALDLPEHRKEAIDACLREGVFPIAMEHLPASDADAVAESMRMVEEADIYVGVFAWRYGWRPSGGEISISEMELDRAITRGIPILVFVAHKDHPLTIDMIERAGDAAARLDVLKAKARKDRVVREFKSPAELRGEVIHALSDLQKREEAAAGGAAVPSFHPPNLIPQAPEAYVAHPYSLLQTKDVVGRRVELNLLTDWVTQPRHPAFDARIFHLVAIGGMGKSALAWKWFQDVLPNELPRLAGRMWWSVYESDAHFENFVIARWPMDQAAARFQIAAEGIRVSSTPRAAVLSSAELGRICAACGNVAHSRRSVGRSTSSTRPGMKLEQQLHIQRNVCCGCKNFVRRCIKLASLGSRRSLDAMSVIVFAVLA